MIPYSDNSFNVEPTKILSDCGGRGFRPDPPSPTGVNLLPAICTGAQLLDLESVHAVETCLSSLQPCSLVYYIVPGKTNLHCVKI